MSDLIDALPGCVEEWKQEQAKEILFSIKQENSQQLTKLSLEMVTKNILIVEDDTEIQAATKLSLEIDGHW